MHGAGTQRAFVAGGELVMVLHMHTLDGTPACLSFRDVCEMKAM